MGVNALIAGLPTAFRGCPEFTAAEIFNVYAAIDRSQSIIEFDLDGFVTNANQNFTALFGYSRHEIVGRHHSLICEPGITLNPEYRAFWARLRAGEFARGEFHRKAASGRDIHIQATYNPVHGADGRPNKVIKVASDVTDLRNAANKVEQQRDQFDMLVNAVGAGIFDFDAVTGQGSCNARLRSMLGLARDEPVPGDFVELLQVHPDDRAHMLRERALAICLNDKRGHEMRCVKKDGSVVWVDVFAQGYWSADTGHPHHTGIVVDISKRKAFEAELTAHRDHLHEIVATQTLGLKLAKETAEAASAAKSEFLSNMSHELRTPMHAISSFARFGMQRVQEAPREKLQHYFQNIETSAMRLTRLLNDLLDLAKIEAGKMNYVFTRANVASLLRASVDEFEALAREKDVSVALRIEIADAGIEMDIARMQQVFANLLSNAFKFSPRGGTVGVSLVTERCDGDGMKVVVSIEDDGPGIPPHELEVIFDKFIQSSKTNTGAGGTGLGLAISREILRAHGGRIAAANRAAGGALFRVELPVMHI